MKIRIISEIKELYSIKDDWDDLYSKADYSTIQSFEFNYYSWLTELSKAKGNQLCVILLTTNERACAILPLYIDFKKRLRFINDKHADFCDVLYKDVENKSNYIHPLPPVPDTQGQRVNYYRTDDNLFMANQPGSLLELPAFIS